MHAEPGVAQQIHRPVPAIGRFDYHLRVAARLSDLLEQHPRIIRDAQTLEPLAVSVHRLDHRPATMQINTDVTSTHRASLPHTRTGLL